MQIALYFVFMTQQILGNFQPLSPFSYVQQYIGYNDSGLIRCAWFGEWSNTESHDARSENWVLGLFDTQKCYFFNAHAPLILEFQIQKYLSKIMSGY